MTTTIAQLLGCSLLDIERPAVNAHCAAIALSIIVEAITRCRNPNGSPDGFVGLLVEQSDLDALDFLVTQVLGHTREARDAFYAAAEAAKQPATPKTK